VGMNKLDVAPTAARLNVQRVLCNRGILLVYAASRQFGWVEGLDW
jgi:hypothetical protein